jgi:hypothetical protein
MLRSAAILSTVMIGAAMISAIDAYAFSGGAFGHFTPLYRSPSPSIPGRIHHARVWPYRPPPPNIGYKGPTCYELFAPPSVCYLDDHGTPGTGANSHVCTVCN